MATFWERTKAAAAGAAEATARQTKKTKLKGEIALIEREMRHEKERFGVNVFDKWDELNGSTRDKIYSDAKEKIEAMKAKIKAKHDEIEALAHHVSATPPPKPPKPGSAPAPPSKLKAKALYAYSAKETDELSLQVGDIVEITSKSGDWWEGNVGGRTGSFPSNYVELL